jgi:enoyl-CoA hydratase/carnithine racemase
VAQVHSERNGRVLTVRLDNPPHNFMTGAMVRELEELAAEVESDDGVGAVVLTGAPEDVFITHFDVGEILAGTEGASRQISPGVARGSLRAIRAVERIPGAKGALERSAAAGAVRLRAMHELFLRMNRMDTVWIAAINGTAMGGGCELALACDIRIMAAGDGRIGLPEASLGIIPGAGGTQRLARLIGQSMALEMMLEARALAPAEALGIGLVHRVVAPARLLAVAQETGERLARRSPEVVAALKEAVYLGASRNLSEGLHVERGAFLSVASSDAARRAMNAYVEEIEEQGPAAADGERFERWRDGTRLDLTQ